MPFDPTQLPQADFTTDAQIARQAKDYLSRVLVDAEAVRDRNGEGDFRAPGRIVSHVLRFDGLPDEAIRAGLAMRTEADRDVPFVVIGYERTSQRLRAANATPKVQALPFSVVLCYPARMAGDDQDGEQIARAERLEQDAEILDLASNLATFFLRTRFIHPHAWGLIGLEPGDVDPGRIAGLATPVNFRRLPFTFLRAVQR